MPSISAAKQVHMRQIPLVPVAVLLVGSLVLAQDRRNATSTLGMVVASSTVAAGAGAAILEAGGNAVDAAVATAFALAVTHPTAGNLGGGGFMLVQPADGSPAVFVDYREKAPLSATPDMYANLDARSRKHHRWVGVPGTVRGLSLAHELYGALAWRDVVAPAVALARDGFVVDEGLAASLNHELRTSHNDEFQRVYGKPGGGPWQAGDRIVLEDLAATLARIEESRNDGFYRGRTAELLVAEMQRGGGHVTIEDLARYRARVRTPIRFTFRGYEVLSAPPPSSGGTTLAIMLQILERHDFAALGRWSPQTVHLIIEAMRRGYATRAAFLGDADFVDIPGHLVSKEFAAELAASIDPDKATPSDTLGPPITERKEGNETTHFSVIDRAGMAVSNTYTLEDGYGSGVVVTGAGFLLNNEMGDFNRRPGVTDRRGAIGTPANVIAPGKRMLSSMTPTIVLRDGKPFLLTGSPGGRTIINTVLCVLLNVLEFGMDLRAAIDAPRLDHEWFPERVAFTGAGDPAHAALVEALEQLGHRVERSGGQGDANSILVDGARCVGAADSRYGGAAAPRR
jgi:gamma-glutamyltranspeptidase/glutathione hydrolase